MTRPVAALVLAVSVAILVPGCRRTDGPAERYRAFVAAARAGSSDAVWDMLSEKSRRWFDARAKDVSAASPAGVVPASGRELVIGDLAARSPRLQSVVVRRESRDAAVVAVELEDGSGAREVTLVREDGAWKVVVPGTGG